MTGKAGIPRRHRHRHPRQDPRKNVGVSGESASMSVSVPASWNASLIYHQVGTTRLGASLDFTLWWVTVRVRVNLRVRIRIWLT